MDWNQPLWRPPSVAPPHRATLARVLAYLSTACLLVLIIVIGAASAGLDRLAALEPGNLGATLRAGVVSIFLLGLPLSLPGLWLLRFYVRQGLGLPSPSRAGWRLSTWYNLVGGLYLLGETGIDARQDGVGLSLLLQLGFALYLLGVALLSRMILASLPVPVKR